MCFSLIGCSDTMFARSFSSWLRSLYVPSISGTGSLLQNSSLTTSQSFEYFGLHFFTYLKIVRPTNHLLDKRHQDLSVLMRSFLILRGNCSPSWDLSIFFAPIVDLGRLHMRPSQLWLASRWDHSPASLDLPVQVTPDLLEVTGVWSDTVWILQGVSLLLKSATT